MGVDQLVTGGDVNDPVVDSLTTEDANIGGSEFVSNGTFLPIISFGAEENRLTTTNTSYSAVGRTQFHPRLIYDDIFTDDQQGAWSLTARFEADTTTMDVRIITQGSAETVLEDTGISSAVNKTIGPTNFTPNNQSVVRNYQIEMRSGNGTAVDILDPTVVVGVQL